MIGQVFCGLSDIKVRDKIKPLIASGFFDELHIFRNSPSDSEVGVKYHPVPYFIRSSNVCSMIYKILTGLFFSLKHKQIASTIISFNCVPHGFLAYLVAKITRTPLVTCLIGTDINVGMDNNFLRPLILIVCKGSKRVVVTGQKSASRLNYFGLENVSIVRNTIDVTRFKMDSPHFKSKNSVVFVGNLTRIKRVDRVIELVNTINDRGHSLSCTIIGEGDEREKLEALVSVGKSRYQFEFLGYRRDTDILLREHIALCLFSEYEGFPAVIAEALCSGLNVLVVSVGDISDIVDGSSTSLICNPKWDLEYFANQLIEIMNDPRKQTQDSAKRYQSIFSYNQGGKQWRQALQSR